MSQESALQAMIDELTSAVGLDPSPVEPTNGEAGDPETSAAEQSAANGKRKKKDNGKQAKGKAKKKAKAPEEKPTFIFQKIPTEKLYIANPDREGNEEGTEAFENTRTNIRKLGIIEPLIVGSLDEKLQKFPVIDGKRRFAIAQLEGIAKVPCHVIQSKTTTGQELLLSASGNTHRKDYTPWELANLFDKILKATNLTQTEVAAGYGFTRTVATDYLKLLDPRVKEILTEEQFEALKKGKHSAKSVTRQIDALDNPKKSKGGKGSIEKIPIEFQYELWSDPVSGITFIARGKEEKHPSIDNIIIALKRWLSTLEADAQGAAHES